MIAHVITQGSRIVREGRHLLVKKDDDVYHTLFPDRLEQLILYGNISVTPPALSILLQKAVDTVFMRSDGRYKGRLATGESKNVFLRKCQFDLCSDTDSSIKIARSIVRGKLINSSTIVSRVKRTNPHGQAARVLLDLGKAIDRFDQMQTVEQLHGLEGGAAARYFPVLAEGLKNRHSFTRRVRRPPTDPVNAVLSLLYTCLINRAYAAVRLAGLDPYPGFLHTLDYGRFSLPLDLVEEFRAPVVDTLTLALFNLNVLRSEHFELRLAGDLDDFPEPANGSSEVDQAVFSSDSLAVYPEHDDSEDFDMPTQEMSKTDADLPTGKPAVLLNPEAYRKVIEAFEKKMNTDIFYPPSERRMTFAEIMVFQARHLRKVIEGDCAAYHPFLLK